MKRILSMLLLAALCASLVGCSRQETPVTVPERIATSIPSPTPTPDPLEAELNEAMALFDAIDLSVYQIDGDGNLGFIETEWYINPTPEVEASNESTNVFVGHMISKGYEFLRKFQLRFLEDHASDEAAKLKYAQASYAIQTGDYYRLERSGENPFLLFDEFYGESDALRAGNCDALLGKLTPYDKKTDEAVFAFLYDQWSDLSEESISYMIKNGLTGVIANTLKVMQADGARPGPNLGNAPEKAIKALIAFEKAGTPECAEVLSAFESGMQAGAYKDDVIEGCARSVQLENLDNAPGIKAKLQSGGVLIDEIKASPRVLTAFMSCPTNADKQTISAKSADLPGDFVANNPQKGRYFLLVDPAPDRNDSFYPSSFDELNLTCKNGEKLLSVNNPNDAQILVHVKFSYKFYRTYYASSGSSTLKIYRGKISLTANDAVTGKKLASSDISASVKSTYTTSPGSLYVSSFPDSAVEKFAKKLVTAAK